VLGDTNGLIILFIKQAELSFEIIYPIRKIRVIESCIYMHKNLILGKVVIRLSLQTVFVSSVGLFWS